MNTERVKELKTITNDFNLKLKNAFELFNNNVYSFINILGYKINRKRKAFSNRIPLLQKRKRIFVNIL